MWLLYAFGSALFAGVTSILAKCGIRQTDSTVATAVRTIVVLAFAWLMVWVAGAQSQLSTIAPKTWLFLVLSGFATGASWLCYYKALQMGDASKVVPIDKMSVVITLILAFVFLHESVTPKTVLGCVLIGAGTLLMVL